MAEKPPFFIFGCPRSGTSLVSRMLDSHHRLGVPYESHIFNTFYPWVEDYGDLASAANRSRLVDDILATDVLRDWQPRPTREEVLAAIREASFGGVFDAVMRAWIHATGKQRWGEKTPQHLLYWESISRFFPEAQVIHIVRDGRDVALSWISARFGPKTIYGAARYWRRYLTAVKRLKQTTEPERICEIRYEDLVTAPQATAIRLCEFLDEDFDPNMLHFYKNDRHYPTDDRNRQNLRKTFLQSNVNLWQTRMSGHELDVFEAVAGDWLLAFGYAPAAKNPRITKLQQLYLGGVEHPTKKVLAMLKNRKGHRDALIRACIRLRLLATSSRRRQ